MNHKIEHCVCDCCGEKGKAVADSIHHECNGLSQKLNAKIKSRKVHMSVPDKKGRWRAIPPHAMSMELAAHKKQMI